MAGRTVHADDRPSPERPSGWWAVLAILVLTGFTIAAFWRTIGFYFFSDDFVLVNLAANTRFAVRPLLTTAGGDGFFRPIGYLSLAWTSMWAGVNPVPWHVTAIALHLANVVLVFMLAARLPVSRPAAFFAAALFAIHGTRPEAVAWIAGRFDLIATFFVLAGLLLFIQSCSAETPVGSVYGIASLVCMILAILSKESAYIFPLLVVLCILAKHGFSRKRIGIAMPYFVTAAALFAYRCCLCGGIGGYRNLHTGKAQALTFGLATLKALGLSIWAALYFPINWSAQPGPGLMALMLAYIAALAWLVTARQSRPLIGAALAFVIICALPPLHLLGIGADLRNSRLLYLPSIGFCLMLALAVDGLAHRSRWIVPAVILAFHAAALQHNLNAWECVSAKARAASEVAVQCVGPEVANITGLGVPGTLRGVPFFANVTSRQLEFVLAEQKHGMFCPLNQHSSSATLLWDEAEEKLRCIKLH
ncbi:MAG TPA: hypothetical protein VG675_08850 [Bryobacteraceae bacterium]|nr:hypothetical protein [Bryobacteraceae bacterium]